MDVEGGLAPVGVGVNDAQLHRVPGRAVRWPHQPALAGGAHPRKLPVGAEREVDQFDVVHGHVGAGIAAGDPLGKLTAADLLGFEQGTVAVVDVPEDAVGDVRA